MDKDGRRERETAAPERAYRSIRNALLDGSFEPGDPLPEERFASQLGVSRTPVREALRRLAAEGLVEILPNRGARVPTWAAPELDAIFELRLRLEGYAARLAATHGDQQSLDDLVAMADAMEQEAGAKRGVAGAIPVLNNQFHLRIVEASGSPRLHALTANAVNFGLISHTFRLYSRHDLERSMQHHREIIDAISYRDPEWAESVMRSHLLSARRILQSHAAVDGARPFTA